MTRILIVDDREDSRYFLEKLLGANGYEVQSACNGTEALAQARQQPPHLIISDLLMPVMDGYTLLRNWMSDPQLASIPFIVYTATYTDVKDEQLALSLGARAFVLKPCEPENFLVNVRKVLADAAVPGTSVCNETSPGHIPIAAPEEEEARHLRQYSEVLIHKLEDKMEQAEKAYRELQRHVSERRQAEEARALLATAVEQAAEAIIITDAQATILYVNPAFEKISGFNTKEIVGRNPRILKSGRHDAGFYRQMWDTLRQGRVWSGHLTNKTKSGAIVQHETTISPVRDLEGKIVNYVGVQHDVTQEVELEAQLRQAQKLEAVGQLAGGVAHDFNNILSVIQGNTSLLMASGLDPSQRRGCADQILQAAERAAGLTRQLLLFSRKHVMQTTCQNLNCIMENMIKMLRRVLGEDIDLKSELAPQLPAVLADVGMMEQVLMNLVVNARDAMPQGGSLVIATGSSSFRGDQCAQKPKQASGDYVWFSVTDTGCGIAEEVKPHIYEPFFTTKAEGKGTGLGLATVYGIVQQHGGWIELSSKVGQGATFRIYLPVAQAAPIQQSPDLNPLRNPGGNETILLVEDDAAVRAIVGLTLEHCGYKVLTAASGISAMRMWDSHRQQVRLLMTDVVMPDGISGFDLAAKLQADEPGLKVIYTSGYASKAGQGPTLIEGKNFLQKPFSSHKLAQAVRSCLDRN